MFMFFGNQNPSASTVEVSVRDHVISGAGSVSHILIEDLELKGANTQSVSLTGGTNVQIKNCQISNSGTTGVFVSGTQNMLIEDNEISDSNVNGIFLGGSDNTVIRGNKVKRTFLLPGFGGNGDNSGAGIFSTSDNNLIEKNEVVESGYIGIRFGGENTVVQHNLVNYFCMTKNDGGGIYAYTGNNNRNFTNRKVLNNIVLNGLGVREGTNMTSLLSMPQAEGIYLDDNTSGVEVRGNTIANISSKGIYLHNARNIKILNNLIYNNNLQMYFKNDDMGEDIRNIEVRGNTFFSTKTSQNNVSIWTKNNDIRNMGVFQNNYYGSPFTDNFRFRTLVNAGKSNQVTSSLDLAGWQSSLSFDSQSKVHPITFPSYEINELIGDNRIDNSTFDQNVNSVNCVGCSGTWTSNSKLDGGALKVSGSGSFNTTFNVGEIKEGKDYILKFSAISTNDIPLIVYMQERSSPWRRGAANSTLELTRERQEFELLIKGANNLSSTSLLFRLENVNNAEYWVDNVEFYEADIRPTELDTKVHFEFNHSKNQISTALSGEFINMSQQPFAGNVNISPFSSVLLLRVSGEPTPVIPELRFVNPTHESLLTTENLKMELAVIGEEDWVYETSFYCGEKLVGKQNSGNLTYTWKDVPEGEHHIHAVGKNKSGLTCYSDTVSVHIERENIPPMINLDSPNRSQTLQEGQNLSLAATAVDVDGEITKVQFFANNKTLATLDRAPFSHQWSNLQIGEYEVYAMARDNRSAEVYTDTVTITVVPRPEEMAPIINDPTQPGEGFNLFLNTGSRNNTTYEGVEFEGDQGIQNIFFNSHTYQFGGASDVELFKSERNGGSLRYEIPVPNGKYRVSTFHHELWFGHSGPRAQEGQRVFDISIEGELVKEQLDLFVESGNNPLQLTFEEIEVTDGILNINFRAIQNRATISGLAVTQMLPDGNHFDNEANDVQIHLNTGENLDLEYRSMPFLGESPSTSYFENSFTFKNSSAGGEPIYHAERNAVHLEYAIPVPNGSYTVVTYHNELWFGHSGPSAQPGRRVFDISLEGNLVKEDVDLFVENKNNPTSFVFENIEVTDGILNLSLNAKSNRATLSGISIVGQSSAKPINDFALFLNAGGNTEESFENLVFPSESSMDQFHNNNSYRYTNTNASTERLFHTERNGGLVLYQVPVPNGKYTVYTYHKELWFGYAGPSARAGRRVFDISLQGEEKIENFDMFVHNGNKEVVLTFEEIEVKDGVLVLEMRATANRATISGLAIVGEDYIGEMNGANLRGYREMNVQGMDELVGQKKMDNENSFKIYPNPAKDHVNISLGTDTKVTNITIHDLSGQLVQRVDPYLARDGETFSFALQHMAQGVYLVSVWSVDEVINKQRLVVKP
jgi:parallel beta-helix repeat protein